MAAITQPQSFGAHSGKRYGSFSGKTAGDTVAAEICARLWVGPMLEATVDTMPMIAVKTEVAPMIDATVGDGCC